MGMAPPPRQVSPLARTTLSSVRENSTGETSPVIETKWKVDLFVAPARSKCVFSLCMLQPNMVARQRRRAFNRAAASFMCYPIGAGGMWLNLSLLSASPMQSADHEPNCFTHIIKIHNEKRCWKFNH